MQTLSENREAENTSQLSLQRQSYPDTNSDKDITRKLETNKPHVHRWKNP